MHDFNLKLSYRTKCCAWLALVAIALSGCASDPSRTTGQPRATAQSPIDPNNITITSVTEGLRLASLSQEPLASAFRAKAAKLALAQGHVEDASRILALIQASNIPPNTTVDYVLTKAQLALIDGQASQALALLNQTDLTQFGLSNEDQIALGITKANAYQQTGRMLAAARTRTLITPILADAAAIENHEQLFTGLMTLPTALLKRYATDAATNDLRGWLSLAAMTKQLQNRPSQQLRALTNWKKLWAGHPAAQQLPKRLAFLDSVVAGQPKKVAILLPQTGPLATAGQAILKGILSAHFDQGRESEVTVYDTNQSLSTLDLVERAVQAGAEFIIGPLDKNRVTELAQARLRVPVLALNRVPTLPPGANQNGNLFFFSLAPEDEAKQLAEHGKQLGYKNILLIAPIDEWGDRTTAAFREAVGTDAEIRITEKRFSEDESHAAFVRRILMVDDSQSRANDLKRITGLSFEFNARRRQDIDMIALLASAKNSKQINPALAFYYADDLPVFATSLVNQSNQTKINNLDLNGIRFCDMPWKLIPDAPLETKIQKAWPEAKGPLGGLFALGLDAFNIMPRLRVLREMPETPFYGLTGALTMDRQIVTRRLMWGLFEKGAVTTLPVVTESI